MKIIFSQIWSFHSEFAFIPKKEERSKLQWLTEPKWVKTRFFFPPSYWFSVSYITDGHGLFTWMDGQINYCRDGAGKQWKHPAPCRLHLHPSFLSHEHSLIFMGGSLLLEMSRSSETDSWLIYLSCRQGGVWYTDPCKRSKGVSYMSEWRYCWEWFRPDSALPCFPLSVLHPLSFPLNLSSTHNCCN